MIIIIIINNNNIVLSYVTLELILWFNRLFITLLTGEENEIIIISLVRSNSDDNLGFIEVENRVCVTMSRAKVGMYVFGNFDMIANKSGEKALFYLLLVEVIILSMTSLFYCIPNFSTLQNQFNLKENFLIYNIVAEPVVVCICKRTRISKL